MSGPESGARGRSRGNFVAFSVYSTEKCTPFAASGLAYRYRPVFDSVRSDATA